jgi:hypothetical protein
MRATPLVLCFVNFFVAAKQALNVHKVFTKHLFLPQNSSFQQPYGLATVQR